MVVVLNTPKHVAFLIDVNNKEFGCVRLNIAYNYIYIYIYIYTGLFISPSGISEFDCATTKTDTAERSISIGRESLQVFFCTRGLGLSAVSVLVVAQSSSEIPEGYS